ncbi:MAG TPA: PAS domain S-box protein [Gemmatimonadales bacterium]|nr:PAS domain S-box protein [Gemmatimonadales bacterium]
MPPIETHTTPLDERVLAVATRSGEEVLCRSMLSEAHLPGVICHNAAELEEELQRGVGCILITQDALAEGPPERIAAALENQPEWSDIPVLLITEHGDAPIAVWAMDQLSGITVLERPIRVVTAVTALRSALKARHRQYELREHLRSLALLASIVATSEDAILSKTLNGTITSWNQGARRLFGYAPEEILNRSVFLLIPPERREEEEQILQRLRRGERIEHYETTRITRHGKRVDVSLTLSPMKDERGVINGISSVARDITERRLAEEALREANQRKDLFLATLAHELRNPLAPIHNSIHILRMSDAPDAVRQQVLPMMERQVKHLVRLVDDLMEVTRISQGKIELRRERVLVADIFQAAVESSRPLIDAGGHRLTVTLPNDPIELQADSVRLTQVVSNLLNNAAKYSPPSGRIALSATVEAGGVVIRVRDEGTGIPPELMPRIFDAFVQGRNPTGGALGGLGIGLTLVRSLVELHGGTVEARSEGTGRGSEFIICLPLPRPDHRESGGSRGQASEKPAVNRRILVVDDSAEAANSLGKMLQLMGHEVQLAYEGETALEKARHYRPDVAVLDLAMPGMDGFELARRLRGDRRMNGILLIALTGYGQEEDRRRSREAGFDLHLVKPADPAELQAVLTAD